MGTHGQLAAHLFGAFRLTIDAVTVDMTSSRRTRNLLAYLILHRRAPVPRDVLMEVFWPDAPADAARNRLNVSLSAARQSLRSVSRHPIIQRRSEAYQITDALAVWVDVEEFDRACAAGRQADRMADRTAAMHHYQAASVLYQGDLLADEPYAAWATAPRDALALEAVDAQRRLMEMYIENGEYGSATLVGRRVLTLDPCHEDVHRHLMTCYAAVGQRHLALAQYRRLAAVLWETYGVLPAAETESLYESLCHPHHDERYPAAKMR
jgi:SARP family transcriptional regulator, regulator of embCAB operon